MARENEFADKIEHFCQKYLIWASLGSYPFFLVWSWERVVAGSALEGIGLIFLWIPLILLFLHVVVLIFLHGIVDLLRDSSWGFFLISSAPIFLVVALILGGRTDSPVEFTGARSCTAYYWGGFLNGSLEQSEPYYQEIVTLSLDETIALCELKSQCISELENRPNSDLYLLNQVDSDSLNLDESLLFIVRLSEAYGTANTQCVGEALDGLTSYTGQCDSAIYPTQCVVLGKPRR